VCFRELLPSCDKRSFYEFLHALLRMETCARWSKGPSDAGPNEPAHNLLLLSLPRQVDQ
jgi:hypothetical protein